MNSVNLGTFISLRTFSFLLRTTYFLNNSSITNMHFYTCERLHKKLCHANLSDNKLQILKLVKERGAVKFTLVNPTRC